MTASISLSGGGRIVRVQSGSSGTVDCVPLLSGPRAHAALGGPVVMAGLVYKASAPSTACCFQHGSDHPACGGDRLL